MSGLAAVVPFWRRIFIISLAAAVISLDSGRGADSMCPPAPSPCRVRGNSLLTRSLGGARRERKFLLPTAQMMAAAAAAAFLGYLLICCGHAPVVDRVPACVRMCIRVHAERLVRKSQDKTGR